MERYCYWAIFGLILLSGLFLPDVMNAQLPHSISMEVASIELVSFEDVAHDLEEEDGPPPHWLGYNILNWGPCVVIDGWLENNEDENLVFKAYAEGDDGSIISLIDYQLMSTFSFKGTEYHTNPKQEWRENTVSHIEKYTLFGRRSECYWMKPGRKTHYHTVSHFLYYSGLIPEGYNEWSMDDKIRFAPVLTEIAKEALTNISFSVELSGHEEYDRYMHEFQENAHKSYKQLPRKLRKAIERYIDDSVELQQSKVLIVNIQSSGYTVIRVSIRPWDHIFPSEKGIDECMNACSRGKRIYICVNETDISNFLRSYRIGKSRLQIRQIIIQPSS